MLIVRREKDARTDEENYFVEFDSNTPPEFFFIPISGSTCPGLRNRYYSASRLS